MSDQENGVGRTGVLCGEVGFQLGLVLGESAADYLLYFTVVQVDTWTEDAVSTFVPGAGHDYVPKASSEEDRRQL